MLETLAPHAFRLDKLTERPWARDSQKFKMAFRKIERELHRSYRYSYIGSLACAAFISIDQTKFIIECMIEEGRVSYLSDEKKEQFSLDPAAEVVMLKETAKVSLAHD